MSPQLCRRVCAVLIALGLLAGTAPAAYAADPVLVGAGDIADCSSTGDEATANLVDGIAGTVFTLGDNAYPDGTAAQFTNCYGPSWGRFKARTHPATGNHEYNTRGAKGYFGYFGAAAGDPTKGYYSYDLGAWHIIVLNSNCANVSCQVGSAQERWLRTDLAAHPTRCTLAYWHHPLFKDGGENASVRPFWQALYAAGADLVLNGHVHNYQRFAPRDPAGHTDSANGIREIIAGTGGESARHQGVLKLTLHATSYDWQYIPVPGKGSPDSGSSACH
jgi:acid phosphatase type 7